jgi:hypothetical protein
MPKTKISEFSATPANNTDIDSINIAEGCAPSGINDAIRELMAQLKDFQTGAVGDSFNGPIGTTTAAAGAFTTLSSTGNTTLGDASGDAVTINGTATFANANPTLTAGTANGVTYLNGSKVLTSGSALVFDGTNLGLGVTPSAWGSSYKCLEVGGVVSYFSSANQYFGMYANAYRNSGGSLIYTTTGVSSGYLQDLGAHKWFSAASGTAGNAISFTQAMTLDASGNFFVGSTSGSGIGERLTVTGLGIVTQSAAATNRGLFGTFGGSTQVIGTFDSIPIEFRTGNTERARITSAGELIVGKTSTDSATSGAYFNPAASGFFHFVVTNTTATSTNSTMYLNRQSSDGRLIEFRQADTAEGDISVSGTTVSYNGGHLSRWAQTTSAKDDSIVKGTVLSNLDEMNVYTDAEGNPVDNEQLNKVKVSDTEGDVNVAGVFVNWSHDEDHNVDEINMAMTGDMIIRIAQGVTVVRGDLLMSAGDGTAKPQGDDIIRSKTVAKVTSNHVTCTYADGSYCVPCVLMAC